MKTLTILLAITLTACAPPLLRGTGQEATPPSGYIKLCKEHPDLAACPKVVK